MFIYNLSENFNKLLNKQELSIVKNNLYSNSLSFNINYVENIIKPDGIIINNLNKQLYDNNSKILSFDEFKEFINLYFDKTQSIFQNRVSINNPELKKKLSFTKNNINKNSKNWDKVKTLTNDYEFVCINNCKLLDTNNYYKKYYNKILHFYYNSNNHVKIDSLLLQSSKLFTLSRSFYKMIETINTFFPNIKNSSVVTSLHLAEGPGGFIEALNYIREKNMPNNNDKYYGITLLNDIKDDNIPSWKKSIHFLKNNSHKVNILSGIDNTGNLINPDNLKYLLLRFKYNKCNLVTGDGGLDFSCNINYQEELATKLIYAQILGGFVSLCQGGNFMLKIFDMNNILTIDMIFLLYYYYENVYIYKPKTSRLANSEKYIICLNFRGCNEDIMYDMINNLDEWNKYDISNNTLINNYKTYKISNKKIMFENYMFKQVNRLVFKINNINNINNIKNIKNIKNYSNNNSDTACVNNNNIIFTNSITKFYKYINDINENIISNQIHNINFTLKYCYLLSKKKLYIKTINNRLITQTLNAQKWCQDNNIPYYNKLYS